MIIWSAGNADTILSTASRAADQASDLVDDDDASLQDIAAANALAGGLSNLWSLAEVGHKFQYFYFENTASLVLRLHKYSVSSLLAVLLQCMRPQDV